MLDCIHEIDLALWYLGPARLAGAACVGGASIGVEADALAELILHHESGALTNVHLNFVQRDYRRTCQIIGTEGTMYWDFDEPVVRVIGADRSEHTTVRLDPSWSVNDMYVDELRHFIEAARMRTPAVNPVSAAAATMKIALAAREARV